MTRPRVSAVVICCDEADRIGDCLASVAWCDEVLVVDSGSRDGTLAIARAHATRVFERAWPGYVAQKNFALEQATGEWVLCLDADERCSAALRLAVEAAVASDSPLVGYRVKRHTFHLGRWIEHGGWYPDWKLRLVRRGRARWGGVDPHDQLIADGPVGRLDADLEHFSYRDYADQLRTVQRFSDLVAEQWARQGRRFSPWRALLHPPVKFLECWLWKQGFRDGWPGFVIAATSSFYVFAKHVKLWERTARRQERGRVGSVNFSPEGEKLTDPTRPLS
ncbi:MAG: glycosyltransferase family 2 protein [Myxococcota bacterium]|nr:glycosyltransferase family 2 protein [Myxococcota bacterium]